MIKAMFSAQTPDTPILIQSNRYEFKIDITEALKLIDDLKEAVETATVLNCPRMRRSIIYSPGNTSTHIHDQPRQYIVPIDSIKGGE